MYQRILVPVDDSATSTAALRESIRFAIDQKACVRLIHVIDLAQFAWSANEFLDVPQLQDSLRKSGEQLLARHAEVLSAQNISAETALLEAWGGNLARSIVDDAAAWKADVLVMGTHGYSGLTHLLLGSVAEGVMRHTQVPILLVRTPTDG
ncbi:universal stress protein [Amantichitinum ursilacus]|uniref:Putative universal stress protein n=1 Tax=Amantichitinum ursilacus TaxID=857265 RepID=A0A0N1JSP8_9NEIS|nr:universal stress protein [Amantichitinum ursilacus]KPC52919.1 putative universal stress protein [Amantichitinum ursilacus]